MKIFGIVLLVFAVLNLIVAILAAGNGAADAAGSKLSASLMLGIIGSALVYWSSKSKDDQNGQ